jgi:hypothetical protein
MSPKWKFPAKFRKQSEKKEPCFSRPAPAKRSLALPAGKDIQFQKSQGAPHEN